MEVSQLHTAPATGWAKAQASNDQLTRQIISIVESSAEPKPTRQDNYSHVNLLAALQFARRTMPGHLLSNNTMRSTRRSVRLSVDSNALRPTAAALQPEPRRFSFNDDLLMRPVLKLMSEPETPVKQDPPADDSKDPEYHQSSPPSVSVSPLPPIKRERRPAVRSRRRGIYEHARPSVAPVPEDNLIATSPRSRMQLWCPELEQLAHPNTCVEPDVEPDVLPPRSTLVKNHLSQTADVLDDTADAFEQMMTSMRSFEESCAQTNPVPPPSPPLRPSTRPQSQRCNRQCAITQQFQRRKTRSASLPTRPVVSKEGSRSTRRFSERKVSIPVREIAPEAPTAQPCRLVGAAAHQAESGRVSIQETETFDLGNSRVQGCMMSRRGGQRKPNQDAGMMCVSQCGSRGIFAVCDGHGPFGHKVADRSMELLAAQCTQNSSKPVVDMVEAVEAELSSHRHTVVHSGVTCCVVELTDSGLLCANVGNCRAIFVKTGPRVTTKGKGSGRATSSGNPNDYGFEELSRDHTAKHPDELDRLEEDGFAPDENGTIWSESIGWNFTRSLGDSVGKRCGLSAVPEVTELELNGEAASGFLIIASDGVFDFVANEGIVQIIHCMEDSDLASICRSILNTALVACKQDDANCVDDITITVVRING